MALLGLLASFVLAGAPNSFAGAEASGCGARQLQRPAGVQGQDVRVRGLLRRFLLYVPKYYVAEVPVSLWVLAPGAYNVPELQVRMSEFVQYAEEQQFAFVALQGDMNLMNVVRHSLPQPGRPDDVAYTEAVLAQVRSQLCVDERRIFCAGYSRGARFCMRLASEMSSTFAAVAPVSGIRFPEPNNATRPMPIIAFHGTADPINPFAGNGNPQYWYDSVPAAVSKWAAFNQCTRSDTDQLAPTVLVERHSRCLAGADVVLVKVLGGGHTWPGSYYDWPASLGNVTHAFRANRVMGQFFQEHPLASHSPPAAAARTSAAATATTTATATTRTAAATTTTATATATSATATTTAARTSTFAVSPAPNTSIATAAPTAVTASTATSSTTSTRLATTTAEASTTTTVSVTSATATGTSTTATATRTPTTATTTGTPTTTATTATRTTTATTATPTSTGTTSTTTTATRTSTTRATSVTETSPIATTTAALHGRLKGTLPAQPGSSAVDQSLRRKHAEEPARVIGV